MRSIRHRSLLTWWVNTYSNSATQIAEQNTKINSYSAFVVNIEHLFVNAAKQNGPDRTFSKDLGKC